MHKGWNCPTTCRYFDEGRGHTQVIVVPITKCQYPSGTKQRLPGFVGNTRQELNKDCQVLWCYSWQWLLFFFFFFFTRLQSVSSTRPSNYSLRSMRCLCIFLDETPLLWVDSKGARTFLLHWAFTSCQWKRYSLLLFRFLILADTDLISGTAPSVPLRLPPSTVAASTRQTARLVIGTPPGLAQTIGRPNQPARTTRSILPPGRRAMIRSIWCSRWQSRFFGSEQSTTKSSSCICLSTLVGSKY